MNEDWIVVVVGIIDVSCEKRSSFVRLRGGPKRGRPTPRLRNRGRGRNDMFLVVGWISES